MPSVTLMAIIFAHWEWHPAYKNTTLAISRSFGGQLANTTKHGKWLLKRIWLRAQQLCTHSVQSSGN